jgi:anaerobic selenocysteine-containing dehydrogenase
MDCPDTCALEVSVEDGRIERIRGGYDHPNTRGFICSKVAHFARRVYHEDRLIHPLKRRAAKGEGGFVRISWEDAVQEITDRFRDIAEKWGGEAILPYHYGGSNGFYSDGFIDDLYFARLGASRLGVTLCAAPTTVVAEAMYGRMPGVAFEDYPEANFILIWGGNPRASNIHLVPYLQEAKRAGAFIAVVDPVRILSPDLVDLHIPVYPGTDLPVALAMIRWWKDKGKLDDAFLDKHAHGLDTLLQKSDAWSLERAAGEARVDAESIRRLADAYASSSPALLRCGWGLERNRNGGQAVAAVLAQPTLLGKFGVRGGGYTLSNGGAGRVKKSELWNEPSWRTRTINMTELGKALNDGLKPHIRGLFVYNCNPLITVPDQNAVLQGLERDDLFTVVFDQVMTDTARYADIVLPATTFLEHHDVRKAYGSYVVGGVRPVIDPRGESRPNAEVFAELGRSMGFADDPFSWDRQTAVRKLTKAVDLHGKPADAVVLSAGKIQRFDFPGPSPVQFETVFPSTRGGKVDLAPAILGEEPYRYQPLDSKGRPLALLSPASSKTMNSTFAEWSYLRLHLMLHPSDAIARNIRDGDRIRVFNELGEVVCRARIRESVREGVVVMPKGAWLKASENERTSTALCPARVSEVGGGACFNDARVEVERIG